MGLYCAAQVASSSLIHPAVQVATRGAIILMCVACTDEPPGYLAMQATPPLQCPCDVMTTRRPQIIL